jgi:hypothetical protein
MGQIVLRDQAACSAIRGAADDDGERFSGADILMVRALQRPSAKDNSEPRPHIAAYLHEHSDVPPTYARWRQQHMLSDGQLLTSVPREYGSLPMNAGRPRKDLKRH